MFIPLDESPFVGVLPEPERIRLFDRSVPRKLHRGEHLCFMGDLGGRVHFVVSGILKLCVCDTEGRQTTLALALPGDITGEIAAWDDEPQPFDVIALTQVRVLGVDKELLNDVVLANPSAAGELMRAMASRLRWIASAAGERTTNTAAARLAARLLDLAEHLGRVRSGTIEFELPLTQTDMGELAGICRESTSKTLNRWKRQGVLEHNGRTLRIFRPDALERIRCEARVAKPFLSEDAVGRERSRSIPVS